MRLSVVAMAALLAAVATLPGPARAQLVMRASTMSLEGLPAVRVSVGRLPTDALDGGLDSADIRAGIELELRKAGVRVLEDGEVGEVPGTGTLFVNLVVLRDRGTGGWIYRSRMELRQEVRLARKPATAIPAATWSAPDAVITIGGRFSLRDDVAGTHRAQVTQFLNDFLAANP